MDKDIRLQIDEEIKVLKKALPMIEKAAEDPKNPDLYPEVAQFFSNRSLIARKRLSDFVLNHLLKGLSNSP